MTLRPTHHAIVTEHANHTTRTSHVVLRSLLDRHLRFVLQPTERRADHPRDTRRSKPKPCRDGSNREHGTWILVDPAAKRLDAKQYNAHYEWTVFPLLLHVRAGRIRQLASTGLEPGVSDSSRKETMASKRPSNDCSDAIGVADVLVLPSAYRARSHKSNQI